MSISEILKIVKNPPQIPITKSTTNRMSNQIYDNRKYPCTICQKRFKASNHLKEHMTLHSDKTNYKCEKCQTEFKAPGAWRNHMRKVHGFECPDCRKNFSTLTLLKQHRTSKHRDVMGKKMKLEDEVGMIKKNENIVKSNGVKTKSGQQKSTNLPSRNIKSAHAGSTNIVKKILAKSRLNGNNVKSGKFECKICGLRYTLARSLRRHLNTAHKDPFKYKCTHCPYTTNRSDNFKSHNERHSEGMSLKCTVKSCKSEFFSFKSLRIHVKKFHTNEVKNLNGISIKKEEEDGFGNNEDDDELLEELDPEPGYANENLKENADETFNFYDNSFLNSTEKSTMHNKSVEETKDTSRSSQTIKKPTQLKISTCFSLNSKKDEKNTKEKPKTAGSSVRYECCECKLDFPGNTELWDHLLAVHYHKMKNNVKKS